MSHCVSSENMDFLDQLTSDVVEASRVRNGEKVGTIGPNTSGDTLMRPGGRGCYPAFWIRDYAMSLDSGKVTPAEQRHALLLTAMHQQQDDWNTPTGSIVPHGSIADHISLGGRPIFFPGTLEDYENQGGKWGKLPSLDDHFYFVHMAWYLAAVEGDVEILLKDVKGMSILDRLELAFTVPPFDEDTHLVHCSADNRGVTFGFVDSIIHTGDLLFCSLLKYQAARELTELFRLTNTEEKSKQYSQIADCIKRSIDVTFPLNNGLPIASTSLSGQPDVWGAAFGVYIDAFTSETKQKICETLRNSYLDGTLAYRGNIRHVRTCDDFSESTAWEKCVGGADAFPKNRYQNGGYWNTPTGWATYAISQVDSESAARLAEEYIDELMESDFRKGEAFGSPWECIHPDGDYSQNPVYMTSVTCPLAAFRRLGW